MEKSEAFAKLQIPVGNKTILCLDGGGIRGILTIQMLKKLEELAGMPCYELFDMVAGTSTGGIIAGLVACGKTATEIETLYKSLVNKVFEKRSLLANQIMDPPLYSKKVYRTSLANVVGETTTLQSACMQTGIDLVITTKDVSAGEETFFTCFKEADGTFSGTYKDVLLRAVMEATMSAPTYFTSLERFVDGGTTTYNNPSLSAIIEGVNYGPKGKYATDKLTVFSFGTGTTIRVVDPKYVVDPKGADALFWLKYIMSESGQDASDMQVDIIRRLMTSQGLDYRRFQISLDETAIKKLDNRNISDVPNVKADWLWELTNKDLNGIKLDDVSKFDLMTVIGQAMTDYVMKYGGEFTKDLQENGSDLLVTRTGDIDRIKIQMSSAKWLDEFEV